MPPPTGRLRRELGIAGRAPVVLYVGRIAAGKGIEHLLEASRRVRDAHVVLVGPDDGHGMGALVRSAQAEPGLRGRIHVLPPEPQPPLDLYLDANLLVLASSGESFGMAAAEALAAGTAVVLTPRVGLAGFLREGEALIVPDEREAVVSAIGRVLGDSELAGRLAAQGREAARRLSWERVVDLQEEIYRATASRTAARKPSTDAS
jgi:glycosyltransferase involved in cell wall biosynthesis